MLHGQLVLLLYSSEVESASPGNTCTLYQFVSISCRDLGASNGRYARIWDASSLLRVLLTTKIFCHSFASKRSETPGNRTFVRYFKFRSYECGVRELTGPRTSLRTEPVVHRPSSGKSGKYFTKCGTVRCFPAALQLVLSISRAKQEPRLCHSLAVRYLK